MLITFPKLPWCYCFGCVYIGHKLYTRKWRLLIPISEIDINNERTIFDEEILNLERQEEQDKWDRAPWHKNNDICF